MKQQFIILLVAFGFLFISSTKAQTKTGYIKVDDVVLLMPETARINDQVEKYKQDSISPQYSKILAMYTDALAKYNDSLKTTAAVHKSLEESLSLYMYQIQNWQQLENQLLEKKQNDLMNPIYAKAYAAIKAVAKEKGYTHVFNKEVYLVAPDGEDMIKAVAAKLGITLPKTTGVGKGN